MKKYVARQEAVSAVEVTAGYVAGLPRMGKQIVGFGETAEIYHKNRKAKTYAQIGDFIIESAPGEYFVMSGTTFAALFAEAPADEQPEAPVEEAPKKLSRAEKELNRLPGEDGPAETDELPDADEVKAKREAWEKEQKEKKEAAEKELEAAKVEAEKKRLEEAATKKAAEEAKKNEREIKL